MTIYKSLTPRKKGYTFSNIDIFKSKEFIASVEKIDDDRYLPIVIPSITMLFDNISNADLLVGDATNVADWNVFFDLPTYGNTFMSVVVTGNSVNLIGGSEIYIKDYLFRGNLNILEIVDSACITTAGNSCFDGCNLVTTFNFPLLTTAGRYCFADCFSVTTFNLPSLTTAGYGCFYYCTSALGFDFPLLTTIGYGCFFYCHSALGFDLPLLTTAGNSCFFSCTSATTFDLPLLTTAGNECFRNCFNNLTWNLPNLTTAGNFCFASCTLAETFNLNALLTMGSSVLNNSFFNSIIGKTITLTIPSALMTCNGGLPDGDIQWLQANNTVTVVQKETITILFDDIANADLMVGDASSVNDWNTYFHLPTNGIPFDSVNVIGDTVELIGGANIVTKYRLFNSKGSILSIIDTGSIIEAGIESFRLMYNLTIFRAPNLITANTGAFRNSVYITDWDISNLEVAGDQCFRDCYMNVTWNLPNLITSGDFCFSGCTLAKTYNFNSLLTMGTSVLNNEFFGTLTHGQTIALTIPVALMTCNSGSPDGDITYLQANNTVSITTV